METIAEHATWRQRQRSMMKYFFLFFLVYCLLTSIMFVFHMQTQYFRTHGLTTEDARQKYSSRVAQQYKDKLSAMSEQAMKTYGTKVYKLSIGNKYYC